MEDDADNNRRSYTPADVRELSDALASQRCAEVRPHPKFTVDGNAETRVLLANEQRALEVCSLSYLAEGLPLPDAVRAASGHDVARDPAPTPFTRQSALSVTARLRRAPLRLGGAA